MNKKGALLNVCAVHRMYSLGSLGSKFSIFIQVPQEGIVHVRNHILAPSCNQA